MKTKKHAYIFGGDPLVRPYWREFDKLFTYNYILNTMKTFIENYKGFDIYFEALEEYDPSFEYWDEELKDATIDKINSGELVLFCAHVTAEKNGIELGDDYLGMCVYESEEAFYTQKGDYFDDMKETVVKEAEKAVNDLFEDWKKQQAFTPVLAGGII